MTNEDHPPDSSAPNTTAQPTLPPPRSETKGKKEPQAAAQPPAQKPPESPPPPDAKEEVKEAVARMTAVDELGDMDEHPTIGLPMCLIRDPNVMCAYADHLGTTKVEAQHRREHITIGKRLKERYDIYKAFCEEQGYKYWTARGFAAALICWKQGVPVREPDPPPVDDILAEIEREIERT